MSHSMWLTLGRGGGWPLSSNCYMPGALCALHSHLPVLKSFAGKCTIIPISRWENWGSSQNAADRWRAGSDLGLSIRSTLLPLRMPSYVTYGVKIRPKLWIKRALTYMQCASPSYGYVYNFCCLLKNSGRNRGGNCHQQLGDNQSLNISFTNSLFYQIIAHTFQSWL